MIKFKDILNESVLINRRSREDRSKNQHIAIQKQLRNYIDNGSNGDIDLSNMEFDRFVWPKELKKIGGALILRDSNIPLPKNIRKIDGNLVINGCKHIKDLADITEIKGSLIAENSGLVALPNNLYTSWMINVSETPLQSLPSNMNSYNLDISYTRIKKIPGDIYIIGQIDADNSKVSEISPELQTRTLKLYNTPYVNKLYDMGENIYVEEEIKKQLPNVNYVVVYY